MNIDWILDNGYLPHTVIRVGIRRQLQERLNAIKSASLAASYERKLSYIQQLRDRPIALSCLEFQNSDSVFRLRSFMETDPKGQLGGLESTDAVRQRHALASRSFKCPACGKSNEDIMAESKNAADAAASTSSQAPSGVEVPSELKMAWKDEMTKTPETTSHAPAVAEQRHFGPGTPGMAEAYDEESAELSEAFVTTGPVTPRRDNASTQHQMTASQMAVPETSSYHHSEPARVIPATARVAPLREAPNPRVLNGPTTVQRPMDAGVPLWVDRAIVVLVVLLVAMILRALLNT
ncbi:hypothetical protein BN1723_013116 [Verticillium longisporum]|uniref:Uncharacterized protein n=1 Tax=Verticillium longisporum TaxID=100787 RepID=A0A0G4LPC6_VERLO|nr:hypothetical protein BN1723_013116 [Verticillium longisporum]